MQVEAWLARAARTSPTVVAVQTPRGDLTYAELLRAARLGAAELTERGAGRGERVAIALPAGIDFAVALHACLLLGAVAVPVDLRLTPRERERTTAGASVMVREPLLAVPRPLPGTAGQGALETGAAAGGPTLVRAELEGEGEGEGEDVSMRPPSSSAKAPPLTHAKAPLSNTPLSDALPKAPPSSAPFSKAPPFTHELDDVCAVIFTSGTAADPRPVELTYGNFLWSAIGSGVALGVDPHERWLCTLPLAHVGGLSILLRSAIYATTAVLHERFDAQQALHALQEQGITLVSLVATTLARLLDAGLREPPALRWALTGGGPVPEALLRRARKARVFVAPTYGLTEACSQVSTNGPPLFCTRVRVDPAGEILVAGPTVAPAAVAEDGWLHTGDLGSLDENGFLTVTGRASETIVSGGENVSPSEVEAALESHPNVVEAGVFARRDDRWGEAVGAIVVLRDEPLPPGEGMPLNPPAGVVEAELRAHCARRLAPFKVPKSVSVSATPLPRTRSGKLLRRELGRD